MYISFFDAPKFTPSILSYNQMQFDHRLSEAIDVLLYVICTCTLFFSDKFVNKKNSSTFEHLYLK